MKRIAFLLISLSLGRFSAQDIDWSQTTHWRIYNIHNKKDFGFSIDTLSHFNSVELSDDSMHSFLQRVTQLKDVQMPIWMGHFVATCMLKDGSARKVELSTYGGFFYDDKTKNYYEVPEEVRSQWHSYLSDSKASIPSR
jgi:hypothetical protein